MSGTAQSFELPARDGQLVRGVSRDTGTGPVGLFLHGLLSDAEGDKSITLWNQAEQYHRSWVRFDMRAHGRSDGTFDEFTISRALEDVRLVLSLFPDRPKILVGSSMGGWVAAQLATEKQLNITGAVLIAPAFSFMMQLFFQVQPHERQQWIKQGHWTFKSDEMEDDFTLSYNAVVDSKPYDLMGKPVNYGCPIRILHGKLDDVVPAMQSVEFMSHMPPYSDVELRILPNADHRLSGHIEHITNCVDEIWPKT